jgi:DME family drug/metabolite transporter
MGSVERPRTGTTRDAQASLLVLLAAVLWGTTGTAQALIPGTPDPLGVGAVRIAIGGAALLLVARRGDGFSRGGRWTSWPVALAAFGVAAFQVLFFAGVERAGVAIGTVVAIGSAPAFAGVLGWAAARERPSPRWAVATAVAVLGAALLIAASAGGGGDAVGVGLCLGAGASYATYAVASKQLMAAGHPSAAVMAVAFAGGAVLLLPLLVTRDISWLADGRGALVALHLGVVTTAVAYLLFGVGLSRIPVAVAATLSLAEPLTASLLGVLLLDGHRRGEALRSSHAGKMCREIAPRHPTRRRGRREHPTRPPPLAF